MDIVKNLKISQAGDKKTLGEPEASFKEGDFISDALCDISYWAGNDQLRGN